jgi:hypothetical protein
MTQNKLSILEAVKKCFRKLSVNSLSVNERSNFIEKLTAEHKKCKLRCQEIEKQVNELLNYNDIWKKK